MSKGFSMALIIQDYCETESKKLGCSEEQYKAGIQLARIAMLDRETLVDVAEIAVKMGTNYRSWYRIKTKNAPATTIRAIVEVTDTDGLVHVVLPRTVNTYDDVERLWRKYRSLVEKDKE
jgi:hypothetical protein